ncbi:hypothetical protein C8T65DRAFT_737141 [Cerioporus squamosus]|nr:hypothetical protein C8T65DRAFT_737141 [Cerioporus squamosus]
MTSSVGAVCSLTDYPSGDGNSVRVVAHTDWNDADIVALEKRGEDAEVAITYCASKAFAEKAAWNLYDEKFRVSLAGTSSPSALPGSSGLLSGRSLSLTKGAVVSEQFCVALCLFA